MSRIFAFILILLFSSVALAEPSETAPTSRNKWRKSDVRADESGGLGGTCTAISKAGDTCYFLFGEQAGNSAAQEGSTTALTINSPGGANICFDVNTESATVTATGTDFTIYWGVASPERALTTSNLLALPSNVMDGSNCWVAPPYGRIFALYDLVTATHRPIVTITGLPAGE